MIHPLMAKVEEVSLRREKFDFDIGDTVEVQVRFLEGDKERIQPFSGLVIAKRGRGLDEMFTVRRIVDGEGVERIFPMYCPKIAGVEIKKKAVVRRAKLYYLRDRIGKKAFTLKERQIVKETTGRKRSRVKARKEKATAATTAEVAAAAKPEAKVRKARVRKAKDGDAKKS
jgi:large subunit ribosomal protein L19